MVKTRYYNNAWHEVHPVPPKINHEAIRIRVFSQLKGLYRIDQLNSNEGAIVKTKRGTEGKVYFQSAPEKGKIAIDCGKYELYDYPFNLEIINFF